jgi:hypothetical protein
MIEKLVAELDIGTASSDTIPVNVQSHLEDLGYV